MKIVLYMRMSTDKQENSIESQEDVLVSYAQRNKMTVIDKYIDEGISGRVAAKRPAFMRMIDDSEKGVFDAVLVYDSSRFARNLEESIVFKSALKRNNVTLISVTEPSLDDDTSLITDAMLGALNEMYSRKLSKAVKRGMLFNAQKGKFQVPPAFGYHKMNGITTIDETESKIVKMIFNMFIEKPAYHTTAIKLNDLGIKTRYGKCWRSTDVKRILKNRAYVGDVFYSGNYYKGEHEPIIESDLFEQAQSFIAQKPQGKKRSESTYKHWLSGLLKCRYCGCAMNHYKGGNGWTAYRCSGSSGGRCKYTNLISISKLEALIKNALVEFCECDDLSDYEYYVTRNDDLSFEIENVKQAIRKLEIRLTRCKEAYKDGVDTIDEYRENKKEITTEIEKLEKQYEKLTHHEDDKDEHIIDLKNRIVLISDMIFSDKYTLEEKSIALKGIISKIVVDKYEGTFTVYYFL